MSSGVSIIPLVEISIKNAEFPSLTFFEKIDSMSNIDLFSLITLNASFVSSRVSTSFTVVSFIDIRSSSMECDKKFVIPFSDIIPTSFPCSKTGNCEYPLSFTAESNLLRLSVGSNEITFFRNMSTVLFYVT